MRPETPNQALQRTRRERRGCNCYLWCAGSLSLGRYAEHRQFREMTMNPAPATPDDRVPLLEVAVATGLFAPTDADALLGGVLDGLFAGALPSGSAALAARPVPGAPPVGWTYVAPDAHADGVWNVWWIGVTPSAHGAGAGVALLRAAEAIARTGGGRLMIIETSALPTQVRARRFYAREGYAEGGRIPDFYGAGDDKVIFYKALCRG